MGICQSHPQLSLKVGVKRFIDGWVQIELLNICVCQSRNNFIKKLPVGGIIVIGRKDD